MLKNLKLRQKFSIALVLILIAGVTLSGITLSAALRQNAKNEVTATALLLMSTMNSIREYTSAQVRPELADRLEIEFLPETVPAYSAREVFETLRKENDYTEFFYKEATLNPTNLRDKADSFEADLVEQFKSSPNKSEIEGFRTTQGRKIFYIARPIEIKKESCLQCHSTVDKAPQSMIDYYGPDNGFGWNLGEIVGAQMISVPASTVINKSRQAALTMVGLVSGIFALVLLLVNWLLSRQVVKPLKMMAQIAEDVSHGKLDQEFKIDSNDEVGSLAKAFTRMQRSLMLAMERLNRNSGRHSGQNASGASWRRGNSNADYTEST